MIRDVLTLSGVISSADTVGFTKIGAGTLILNGTSTNTYSGATAIAGGILQLGAADVIPDASAVTVDMGATFDLND